MKTVEKEILVNLAELMVEFALECNKIKPHYFDELHSKLMNLKYENI